MYVCIHLLAIKDCPLTRTALEIGMKCPQPKNCRGKLVAPRHTSALLFLAGSSWYMGNSLVVLLYYYYYY